MPPSRFCAAAAGSFRGQKGSIPLPESLFLLRSSLSTGKLLLSPSGTNVKSGRLPFAQSPLFAVWGPTVVVSDRLSLAAGCVLFFVRHRFQCLDIFLKLLDVFFNQLFQVLLFPQHFAGLLQTLIQIEHAEIHCFSLPMYILPPYKLCRKAQKLPISFR